jgi:hypothetical protein
VNLTVSDERAMQVKCPKCKVEPGKMCRTVTPKGFDRWGLQRQDTWKRTHAIGMMLRRCHNERRAGVFAAERKAKRDEQLAFRAALSGGVVAYREAYAEEMHQMQEWLKWHYNETFGALK